MEKRISSKDISGKVLKIAEEALGSSLSGIELSGTELIGEWVTMLKDGKESFRITMIENGRRIQLPDDISDDICDVLCSELNVPDLRELVRGCSYKCETFTVCDPDCHQERICYWLCTGGRHIGDQPRPLPTPGDL